VLPQELQAARLRLVKSHPYLSSAAWALQPVAKPGLETLAVDMWWRLYYDPVVITRWTVEELAGVLYHEIAHLLRDHASRMQNFDRNAANIAADAEINDDLIAEGVKLPDGAITPASIGQPDGLLAEEYYAALQTQQSVPDQGTSAQPGNSGESQENTGAGKPEAGDTQQGDGSEAGQEQDSSASADQNCEAAQGDGASSTNRGGGEENRPNPSQTTGSGSQADDAQPGDRGNGGGSEPGDPDGSQPSDAESGESGDPATSSRPASSGQPSGTSDQPAPLSQPPVSPGFGHGNGQDGRESGDQAQTPAPGAGRCGSCATGQPEPWEEGPPGEGSSPGISRAEAELVRRAVARQIKEHVQSRGDVPGHWTRWADEKLRPKVDWRKELASTVRHAVADVAGASDYSYRRPSRRQGQVGNGKVVLPSLRRPVPSVAVVVDTSGSIGDAMLSQALAEISGILKSLGQREGVHVLACDAEVQACRQVFRPEQVQLAGGGGTDMGTGLEAAARLRPAPQVCIVITDGHTPWPDTAPRGMKVIVALTGEGETPEWAKTIRTGG
jgi:predicted metal-dependent peptidase